MSSDEQPPKFDDSDLESMLKRGRLADPVRARVIREVLERVGAPEAARRRARSWRWPSLFAMTAAAATIVIFLVVRPKPRPEFEARGQAASKNAAGAYALDVGCSNGSLDRCPAGSTLIFRAQITGSGGYLLGYADPQFAGGERIWYFAGADAPVLPPAATPRAVERGIRIGVEHAPGTYAVHLVVARRQLTKAEIVAPAATDVIATRALRLVVVP